ncbi:MAG: hypothetical protein IPK35_14565 [Saprospiraceae bacterium]|jgi:hypothetical protein|nr:hypothetical protein [Saprospiraceae bacterium]
MKQFLTIIFSLVLFCLSAQKLTLVGIEENRSQSGSWDYCKVEVKPIGDEVRNFSFYKITEVKKAADNKGINLLSETQEPSKYKPVNESIIIQLQKASRSASTISLDGVVSFFKPTEANGGIVKISDFRKKAEVNLAPKNAPYGLFYYDKAALQKLNKTDLETRYKEIEKLPEGEKDFAYNVGSLVTNLSYYSEEDIEKAIFLVFKGDASSVMSLEFEDAKGKKIANISSSVSNNVHTYFFSDNLEPGIKLLLNVDSPKAVKNVPFVLAGVDLP